MEQPLFRILEAVICVDSKARRPNGRTGLIEDKEYEVQAMKKFRCCGMIGIDVGLPMKSEFVTCKCGIDHPSQRNWRHQMRFISKKIDKELLEEIREELISNLKAS